MTPKRSLRGGRPRADYSGVTAAIYVRVSTQEQSNDLQLTELRGYITRMGWDAVEYVEKGSSVKKRPVLERLMADAKARRFDVVLVWKLDRFARSLQQLVANIQLLDTYGVRFIALTQSVDTDQRNPASRLMLQILGAVAEFERGLIVERVKAGQAQHKADFAAGRIGKEKHTRSGRDLPAGRPRRIFRRDLAVEMRRAGKSYRAIAKELGVPLATIADALKSLKTR